MSKLKGLSSRKSVQTIKPSLEKIKVYARGWLNYYGIASMRNNIEDINGWRYHRIRMCIWKQWKLPRTKKRNLINMGVHEYCANMAANCQLALDQIDEKMYAKEFENSYDQVNCYGIAFFKKRCLVRGK